MAAFLESLRATCKLSEESELYLQSNLVQSHSLDTLSKDDYITLHHQLNEGLNFTWEGSVKEFKVPAKGVDGGIPIDVIKPSVISKQPGIIVYFHGGGNMYGSRKTADYICKIIASELKCMIISVEYRLAPDFKFPSMMDDGKSVTRWVIMNKPLIGAENDSKVGVMGSSAGGGIAATVAFEVPAVDFQILVYPLLDWRCDSESYTDQSPEAMEVLNKMLSSCVESESDRAHVRASPILQPNFSKLPPTLMVVAEADPLKASNYAFKAKMKAANIPCESKLVKSTVHGFFSLPGLFKLANCQARDSIARFFKKNGTY